MPFMSPVHSFIAFLWIVFGLDLSRCSSVDNDDVIQDGSRRNDDSTAAVTFVYNVILCVAVTTSAMTLVFSGLCICCRRFGIGGDRTRSGGNYVGRIDLADIQVIYNPSVVSAIDRDRLNNAKYVSHDSTVLENTALENTDVIDYTERSVDNKPSDERRHLANANTTSTKLSNVLVENGRIVLQYTNVHAPETPSTDTGVTSSAGTGVQPDTGRTKIASRDDSVETNVYDMNDIVWKNPNAKY